MAIYRVPGPCVAWFGTPTPKSLGTSKTGVTIRTRTSWTAILDDAHGTEPSDYIYTGKACQVEVPALDVALLKAAAIWTAYGGLMGSTTNGLLAIGALASALGQQLNIVEREGSYTWTALKAVPLDPDSLLLTATVEEQIPVTFLIVPDANGKLFSTIPSYIL